MIAEWQARTDESIAELRRDVGDLHHDMQDVRERLARQETIILAQHEPGFGDSDG